MEDFGKYLIYGFFALLVGHSALNKRAERVVHREITTAFNQTGQTKVRVSGRGMFGLYANDVYRVDVRGSGYRAESMPFVAFPRSGWKGRIRHLKVDFQDFHLRGLPIRSFQADIPYVRYDLGQAFYKDRLKIRSAQGGEALVVIGDEGLKVFLERKYKDLLSDVVVKVDHLGIEITAKIKVLGIVSPLRAVGLPSVRDGRYIDLSAPKIELNGRPVSPIQANSLTKQLNPILDIVADLGLGDFFKITRVEIGTGAVHVHGMAAIPDIKADKPSSERVEQERKPL